MNHCGLVTPNDQSFPHFDPPDYVEAPAFIAMGPPGTGMPLSIDRDRFVSTMQEQATIGSVGDSALDRLALSDADQAVRDWFIDHLEAAGLSVRIDEMGNMFGRRPGADPEAAPVLVGSHLDSQPNGGIYDGALGVIAALEFVRTLNDREIQTSHPVEIVNWTNEEGSRFQPAMMASGVWAGTYDVEEMYDRTDTDGNQVGDELERIGYKGDSPAEPTEPYDAYLELHVEQGPRLETAGVPIGVVTGIVGLQWGAATFTGEPNHAGPTPMHTRHDALVAAADFIQGVRRTPGAVGEQTVATVGHLDVYPNSINIVPGNTTVTWDTRDPEETRVTQAADRIRQEARAAADREGVTVDLEERMRAPAVDFAERCVTAVESAAAELGYPSHRLHSGAGHDATHVTEVCDTGMVFAVSEDGISHSPAEYTSWDDCYKAASVLANAAYNLAE